MSRPPTCMVLPREPRQNCGSCGACASRLENAYAPPGARTWLRLDAGCWNEVIIESPDHRPT
jgi:hypothetical protein